MAHSRRTRSQLALPAFDLNQLGRSPLKDARLALRGNQSPDPADPPPFSPLRKQPKRPSSPLSHAFLHERELKRAKHGEELEENRSPLLSHRPPSASSMRKYSPADTPTRARRAQSVPAWPSAPLIDFTHIPRSPSKPLSLRISPLPSGASPNVLSRPYDPPAELLPHNSVLPQNRPCSPTQSSPSVTSPLSPLTPLPGSPNPLASTLEPPDDAGAPSEPSVGHFISSMNNSTDESSRGASSSVAMTPSASLSRLPRLSVAPPSHAPPSNGQGKREPSNFKAPPTRPEGRPRKPGQLPLGGRTTRSATLRQRESMKNQNMSAEKSKAAASLSKQLTLDDRLMPARLAPAMAGSPGKSTPFNRRRSLSGFAQPTASSSAKSNPPSPEKHRSVLPLSSSSKAPSTSAQPASLNSSLSSLSLALQKLCMPAPSKPITSLAVHSEPVKDGQAKRPPHPNPAHANARAASAASVRAVPLQRAAPVGNLAKPSQSQQSKLMLPPPASRPAEATKRINIYSGLIAGKPKGNISFGRPEPVTPAAGLARATSAHPPSAYGPRRVGGNRIFLRASKKTSLPVVEGSPVKGGMDGSETGANELDKVIPSTSRVNGELPGPSSAVTDPPSPTGHLLAPANPPDTTSHDHPSIVSQPSIKPDASRRASLASQIFPAQQSSQPHTPLASSSRPPDVPSTASPALGKRNAPATGAFRQPTTYSLRPTAGFVPEARSAPTVMRRPANAARVSGRRTAADMDDRTPGVSGGGTPTRIGVLRDCTVFVDVRTDDGDDAGALFVDMLNGMGAKVLTRVGQTCTHIVFKNGLLSTLTRYRLLKEPRPLVVGIAWVVECAEQRTRVDEMRFLVSLDSVNVAGTQKRRRSMLPRQFHTLQHAADADTSGTASPDGASPNLVPRVGSPMVAALALQQSSSPSVAEAELADQSGPSRPLLPLEKARRRRSVLQFGS